MFLPICLLIYINFPQIFILHPFLFLINFVGMAGGDTGTADLEDPDLSLS
jgi:hypothetical protein